MCLAVVTEVVVVDGVARGTWTGTGCLTEGAKPEADEALVVEGPRLVLKFIKLCITGSLIVAFFPWRAQRPLRREIVFKKIARFYFY